jgi:hypothetical protein
VGLKPDTARLQILTEFFSPPQPTIQSTAMPVQAGLSLTDESLGFGLMQMVPGRAFLMGASATDTGAMVDKQWLLLDGRQFLVEEVPVDAILEGLAALPLTAMNSSSGKYSHTASRHLKLPPQRLVKNTSKTMMLAKADLPTQGLVLDYQTLNSSQINYTFRGDTTYYISGTVNLSKTNTFEGNAVLKFATTGTIAIISGSAQKIIWAAGAYRPVIFTAKDDNTVGESVSTNAVAGYYGNPMLSFPSSGGFPTPTITGLRVCYAQTAIQSVFEGANIYDSQFVNCQNGLSFGGAFVFLGNALFDNTLTNFILTPNGNAGFTAQNATFSYSKYLVSAPTSDYGCSVALVNCILSNVTNLQAGVVHTTSGNYNGLYNCQYNAWLGSTIYTNLFYPFQSAAAGNYYLTNGGSFFNVGTTNIDATLLTGLKQRTTYSPILYSNVTVSINITLNPQAQRDTDTPDLGYHYDPIDYLVDQFIVTNATLNLNNGVAIASYNDGGLVIEDGSSIVSIGSPLYPNWLVRYTSVQEQPVLLGSSAPSSALTVNPYHVSVAPVGQFRFTKFACPAGGGDHLYHNQPNWSYSNLLVQDCEFWSGANLFGGNTNTVATIKNNLFWRSTFSALPYNSTAIAYLYVTNNLFWGVSSVAFSTPIRAAASTNYCVFNNDFDSCSSIGSTTVSTTNGYNAYLNSTGYIYPTNVTDIFTNVGLVYQTGPLGTFYQTTNSPLIDKGSTNANLVGLYHYTVITNLVSGLEIKETNSIVDIGYHYVAVDTNGIPIDTNGDGIPDYLEDANGNGLVDSGEIGWNIVGDLGLQVLITRPRNGSTIP